MNDHQNHASDDVNAEEEALISGGDAIKRINPVYAADFNRVAKALEARCRLTGENPDVRGMEIQIALRAGYMKVASLRREITSIRSVVNEFLEEGSWPEGVDDLKWIQAADIEDVSQLHAGLIRTSAEFIEISPIVGSEMVQKLLEANYPGSEEDALRALSGLSSERSQRQERDKVDMKPITERDFMELELHFSDHPHQNALKSFTTKRVDAKALLRIFMRVMRLTGMRPVEVFTCRIYVAREEVPYRKEDLEFIYRNPHDAIESNYLQPFDRLDPRRWGSMSAMIKSLQDVTGVPPILRIEAAKTTNSNPDLVRKYRVMILKDIAQEDLEVLCLAGHIHLFNIDEKRRSNLITTMTRNLSLAANEVLDKRKDTLNLYSFRHDFATRARLTMDLYEVAALMGHTAKTSTYTYGKKHVRKKSGSSGGGWLPLPDREFANRIREKWGSGAEIEVSSEARLAAERISDMRNAKTDAEGSFENEAIFSTDAGRRT